MFNKPYRLAFIILQAVQSMSGSSSSTSATYIVHLKYSSTGWSFWSHQFDWSLLLTVGIWPEVPQCSDEMESQALDLYRINETELFFFLLFLVQEHTLTELSDLHRALREYKAKHLRCGSSLVGLVRKTQETAWVSRCSFTEFSLKRPFLLTFSMTTVYFLASLPSHGKTFYN